MADSSYCIKVVCRVRPLNGKEKAAGNSFVVGFPTTNVVTVGNKTFQYDSVLRHDSTQEQVYTATAQPLVKDVLSGYNATIFAYGQTSSGKTHTMEGDLDDVNTRGIIPRIIYDLFDQIYEMDSNLEFHIKVSYFELYMEKVRDLLDITKVNLPIHENKQKVPYVKGVTERFVTIPEEVLATIEEGKSNRHVSVTNMNAHSSRSHAIFLISIKQVHKETQKTLTGKLFLVDLAGSEKVEKTNAQGLTLDEAKTINKSLLALSNVISKLSEGSKSHIPYRDSKLTRVLQESLGGNARTTLIICCSPSGSNESETKGTLLFGERAKMIKNKVEVNIELTAEEWRKRYERQKEECDKLKALIQVYTKELTRWRAGDAVPIDEQFPIKAPSSLPVDSASLTTATPTQPLEQGGGASSISALSAKEFEAERSKLYQQLDDKDEEIHQQTQKVEALSLSLKEMNLLLETSQEETMKLQEQMSSVERELVHSQEEVQEVMQALEELATSYDSKDTQIKELTNENEAMITENNVLKASIDAKDREINELMEGLKSDDKRRRLLLGNLCRDMGEMGDILGTKQEEKLISLNNSDDLSEGDYSNLRSYFSNIRIEARSLVEQRNILEESEREARQHADTSLKELNSCRLKYSDLKTQSDLLKVSVEEVREEKEELEKALIELNEQLLGLRGKERESLTAAQHDRKTELEQEILKEELQKKQLMYQEEVLALRDEIKNKELLIIQLQEQQVHQELAQQSLQDELIQLQLQREEYASLSNRYALKQKVDQDYSGLMDTKSEMSKLDSLKRSLYEKLKTRLKNKGISPERQETKFLEENLEELSRVHKKTLSSFSEVQRDLLKHQSLLEVKSNRVKELETLLKETRLAADKEYRKLIEEKDQMKINFLSKLKERDRIGFTRRQGPTIVRPVSRPQGGAESRSVASVGGSREALLAVAGVNIVGTSKRSPLLDSGSGAGGNGNETGGE
ncbi:PREDICTED: kinesin heavy chain-like isoform X2 [Amphimedon queenslandica]|uniref:Kinesin-like protein n=1 Tax=Amphimedon queenslandica TaxID=400682 RepID=A0AAN0JJC0_AMPQE|nr:PREDICTED: kinesin heavy chain-like isoform X2 [Amphimedon queenslandica]|eukprot:XP_019856886.1 PREDICTED: kinesin heavy chain-like isoform X2 [Amphimedon queenslandica]